MTSLAERRALRDLMRSEDIWFECFNRRAAPMSMWDCDGKCTAAWARPLAPHLDREIALFSRFPFTGLGHKGVPDLDNFVAYHFCLAMLATFSRPWDPLFSKLCTVEGFYSARSFCCFIMGLMHKTKE